MRWAGDRVIIRWPHAAGQVEVRLGHIRVEVAAGPLLDHGGSSLGAGQPSYLVGSERQVQDPVAVDPIVILLPAMVIRRWSHLS
jgi:hypothetical protein